MQYGRCLTWRALTEERVTRTSRLAPQTLPACSSSAAHTRRCRLLRVARVRAPLLPLQLAAPGSRARAVATEPPLAERASCAAVLLLSGVACPSPVAGHRRGRRQVLDRVGISSVAAPVPAVCGRSPIISPPAGNAASVRRNVDALWPPSMLARCAVDTASSCAAILASTDACCWMSRLRLAVPPHPHPPPPPPASLPLAR